MAKADLTAQRLRELLHYDPETGSFTWVIRSARATEVGAIAGSHGGGPYVRIQVMRHIYRAHRLAWLYVHGEWPMKHIDHINGIKTDNRISNLRAADASINMQNTRYANANNKLGVLGVSVEEGRFRAQIKIKGFARRLGTFATAEEAHEAYLSAKRAHHVGCTI